MLGFLSRWLACFTHNPVTPPQHVHKFEKLVRLHAPRRDVFDCACGLRQVVTVGALDIADQVRVVNQGSSLENVLINTSLL